MSTRNKLISVIVATHNRPHLVTRTLSNLLEQSYRPLEIVVVDDGSAPATRDAIDTWKARLGPDVRFVYRWQENQGPATARNKGIETCTGELIHFLDDDDLLCPDALTHLKAALRNRNRAIAAASYQYWRDGGATGSVISPRISTPSETLKSMIQGSWFVPIHGYLFARTAIDEIGPWNPALTSQEDDEYLLRAALSYVPFVAARKALVYYCHHEGVRRATPGKPGESKRLGLEKRMYADLAIRESAFEALRQQDDLEEHRPAFLRWRARLHERYASILNEHTLKSDVFDWIAAHDDARASHMNRHSRLTSH